MLLIQYRWEHLFSQQSGALCTKEKKKPNKKKKTTGSQTSEGEWMSCLQHLDLVIAHRLGKSMLLKRWVMCLQHVLPALCLPLPTGFLLQVFSFLFALKWKLLICFVCICERTAVRSLLILMIAVKREMPHSLSLGLNWLSALPAASLQFKKPGDLAIY